MNPFAVILDRDGVLTHFDVELAISFFQPLLPISLFELAKRWQNWGSIVGFPSSVEQERIFFSGFWRQLRQEYDLTEQQYRILIDFNYTDYMRCFPEVKEVLHELKRRDVPVGVLSNFSLASLEGSLDAIGLLDWIDVACAAPVIGYAKPQPEAYQHVARLLHVPPAACLFFDDEAPCVAGAREIGMAAYLVDRQYNHDERDNYIVYNLTSALDLLP